MSDAQLLCLSMYTYRDLLKQGEAVIQFIERALELMNPMASDLRLQPWYRHGTHGSISRLNSSRPRVWDQILAGELESLIIAQGDWEHPSGPPFPRLELHFAFHLFREGYQRLRYPTLPEDHNVLGWPKSLLLTFSLDQVRPEQYMGLFDAVVELGAWTVDSLGAVYGFVSVGGFGMFEEGQTSYEKDHHLTIDQYNRAIEAKCRGVFHVNFLTEGHLSALGDLSSVAWPPAVARVEPMRVPGSEGLILRVGEPESPLPDADVKRVEALLAPILPHRRLRVAIDLINPGIAAGIESLIPQLEAILSPSKVVRLPNGAALAFLPDAPSLVGYPEESEVLHRVFLAQQAMGYGWGAQIGGWMHPGWILSRVGTYGSHLNRLPYIWCSSLVDADPFEATLWLGSRPTEPAKRRLTDLFGEWAGFRYPGYSGEADAVRILDIQFREREAMVQAEIRAHRGYVLATLISMLDSISVNQLRISELVLGRIEDMQALLMEAQP